MKSLRFKDDQSLVIVCADLSPRMRMVSYVCNRGAGHSGNHRRELPHVREVAEWDDNRATDITGS